jgi:hypothetical protein
VTYEHAMVASAEYQLALVPRVLHVLQWRVAILPGQPNPLAAWQDAHALAAVALDQPDVLADVKEIDQAYLRQEYLLTLARQTHAPYTPDYTDMRAWLDFVASDSTADLTQAR